MQLHRDVLLVANLRLTQRARLRAAGVSTIDELAAAPGPVPGISDATLATLRQQARMQATPPTGGQPLNWMVINPAALAAIPEPNPGDIFFDFEGDPLYEEGTRQDDIVWGLDYLFGLVEPDDTFVAFWAHEPRRGTPGADRLPRVRARAARRHPGMHIYHYAPYERTHLLMLAARHGVGEEAVDDLLRNNVLVDLYPVVRQGLRIGSRSYSLKKLEPLYMGDDLRAGVSTAADSISEYARSRTLLASGDTDAASEVPPRHRRLQRIRLPVDPASARLAARPGGRERGAAGHRCGAGDRRAGARARPGLPRADRTAHVPARLAHAGPDRACPGLGRDRLPPAGAEVVLVGPLQPAGRAPSTTGPTPGTCSSSTGRRSTAGLAPFGRPKLDRRLLRLTARSRPGSSIKVGQKPFLLYDPPYPPIAGPASPAPAPPTTTRRSST